MRTTINTFFRAHGLLISILVVATLLRLISLEQIPAGLHRDEASTGYNAYSIITSGYDERGRYLPLVFEAFGDWKRPLNIYLTAIFIPLFGLGALAVRLPIAICGIITVALVYCIVERMTKYRVIALLATLVIALSPWHIFMSRTGLGWNVIGLLFFLLGCYFLLISKSRLYLRVMAMVSFGLTLFSYASYQIITPLFLLLVFMINRRQFIHKLRSITTLSVWTIFFIIFVYVYVPVFTINASGSTFFSRLFIYEQVVLPQAEHQGVVVTKLLHNKPLVWATKFIENYVSVFSPQFLFFNSGDNPAYSLKFVGNLYLFQFVFLIVGVKGLSKLVDKRYLTYFYLLLFIAPIPAALTQNPYSATRTLLLVPLLSILIASGMYESIIWLKQHRPRHMVKITMSIIACVFIFSFIQFADEYFIHFPINRAGHWGVAQEQVTHYILAHGKKYKEILISRPQESLYIYLMFYGQVDPNIFRKNMVWYPPTTDGFIHAKQFRSYAFRDIRYPEDLRIPNRLIVDKTIDMQQWAQDSSFLESQNIRGGKFYIDTHVVADIRLPDGSPYYTVLETVSRYENTSR